jgi:hypothetical protein
MNRCNLQKSTYFPRIYFLNLHRSSCSHIAERNIMSQNLLHCRENVYFSFDMLNIYCSVLTKLTAGYTEGQECRLCGYEKEDSVHIVCDCPVLACKRYRILGYMFLKPEDLENMRVSSLLSLVTNSGLAWTGEKTQRNSNDLSVTRVLQGTPRLFLLLLLLH